MKLAYLMSAALLVAAATPALAEVSDGKVKIGILNDQSGVYADFGGKWSFEAAKMAVEDFGGKVQGAPIEVISADHQNKPDIASNIARQWYDTEQVDAIMELTTSSVALAVQGISAEKKKIDIVTGAATTDLTGKACSPYGFHWAYDTHALAVGTGGALVKQGGDTWFFLTADYAFGYSLEEQTSKYVTSQGGKVLGAVRHPLATTDYSSFLLQAQSSGAKVIGLANAGLDTANSIKQAAEFGIVAGGQRLAALLFTLAEVHGLGLEAAQGLTLTEGFYWDRDDESRAFAKKYMERTGRMPNMVQAGTYSAVTQYLKAIDKAGTDETEAVAKQLHEMPVDDVFGRGGKVGPNGRMIHDMYLMEVKKPSESKQAVGLLQGAGDRPRRRSLYQAGGERLPAGQVTAIVGSPAIEQDAPRAVLTARGLRRDFRGFVAVNNVDLDVHHGQIHALIGPNGAGKTTVFNLLTKFLPPSAGTIELLGRDITQTPPAKVARMGLVRSFQISAIFPHLTVLDNVRVALQRPRGLQHPVLALDVGARHPDAARRGAAAFGRARRCARPAGRRSFLRPQARAGDRHHAGARPQGAAARRADGRHGPRGCRHGRPRSSARSPRTAPS